MDHEKREEEKKSRETASPHHGASGKRTTPRGPP